MDNARKQTDIVLNKVNREIGRVYETDTALKRIQKKYYDYMDYVAEQTQELYDDYISETDRDLKEKKRKAYAAEVKRLTLQSKEYKELVKQITETLAEVNQRAINVSNDALAYIYTVNYNQAADGCREVGIKVYGKNEEGIY